MNQKPGFWFSFLFAIVCVMFVAQWAVGQPALYSTQEATNFSRSCVFSTGAPATIDCSAAASASSSQLDDSARYMLFCTDASYIRFGATAPTAAAGDMILPSGSWLDFSTNSTVKYVACKNVNTDKACYVLECN